MKQKIVIKVQMHSEKKRCKAMQVAVVAAGVDSVSLEGDDRSELVVVGERVDSTNLTNTLRKKVGHADILKVEEVKEEKKEEEKPKPPECPPPCDYPVCAPRPLVLYDYGYSNSDACSVM